MLSPHKKLRIIVGGMVGQYPLGGVAWDYFHYLLGLSELGHDVYYHEDTWCWPFDPVKGYPSDDPTYTVNFLRGFFEKHAPHLTDRWHFLFLHDKSFGMDRARFDEIARTADVFLNVSGASFFPDALNPKAVKVFMDTDPGYNQIMLHERHKWSQNVERWCQQVASHDRHLTYAENIYADDCLLPKLDFDWRPTRCVVTLPPWEPLRHQPPAAEATFTTVMSWTFFGGPLTYNGVEYGAKGPEFDKFNDLPKKTNVPIVVAIAGHHKPGPKIIEAGWNMADGWSLTLTPESYIKLIADSAGEWSIAKNVYVATRTGWFSCRTACYLAAGRPAVVQDTAWTKYVPSGEGILAFNTMDECLDGLNRVTAEPERHRAAAYEVAREYVAADRVLPPMIETIFATGSDRPLPPSK